MGLSSQNLHIALASSYSLYQRDLMLPDPTLPPALTAALANGNLAVFSGAGVSMLPPSSLPSWWELNSILVEEAKRLTLNEFGDLPAEALDRIRALSLSSFPVESLSDLVVNGFAGQKWFSVLEILDGTVTNANHRALAQLVAKGVVQVLVTTNFDTLIERAFREEGLRLAVLSADSDLAEPPQLQADAMLLKIHGTVTDSTTLVDTVTQKLRGLPLSVRHMLNAMFRDQHVLVLGYSGADLSFGDDYLALSGVSPQTPGITWLVPPQYRDSVHARVRESVERAGAGGCIVYDTLPEFWTRLGLEVPASPAPAVTGAPGTAAERMRASIEALYRQPEVGPLNVACFVLSLLERTGDGVSASHLTNAIAAHSSLQGPSYPLAVLPVLTRLSSARAAQGYLEDAERWVQRSMLAHQALARMVGMEKPHVYAEYHEVLAGSYNNLGLYAMLQGNLNRAADAFHEARMHAEAVDAHSLVSLVTMNRAQLAGLRGDPAENVLMELRRALHWAGTCGYGQVLAEAGVAEAEQLMLLAEYWAAGQALERAEPYLRLKAVATLRGKAAMIRAELEVRRGNSETAAEILEGAIGAAVDGGDERLATALRAFWIPRLAFNPTLRGRTLEQLAELNKTRGSDENFQRELEKMVLSLSDDARPELSVSFPGMDKEEQNLRTALVEAGFHGDWKIEARVLEALAHRKSDHPARRLELSRACHAAALRAGDPGRTAHALYLVGSSLLFGGEVVEAGGVLESALAVPEIASRTRDGVFMRLAEVHSRTGALDEAERLLVAARASRSSDGDIPGLLVITNATARLFVNQADPARAADVLREVAGDGRLDPSQRQGLLTWADQLVPQGTSSRSEDEAAPAQVPVDAVYEAQSVSAQLESAWEAWGAGRVAEAERVASAALSVASDTGNSEDILSCAWLLECIAGTEQRWNEARKYGHIVRGAASELELICEEIDALSRICRYAYNTGDIDAAVAAVRACDVLSRGLPPSEALAYAWYVSMQIAVRRGKSYDAMVAARRCLEVGDVVGTPALASILGELRQMLDTVSAPRFGPTSVVQPHPLVEVDRLNRAGRYGGALHRLELLELEAHVSGTLAIIAGLRGDVFQSADRHAEAVAEYLRAAELFREAGDDEQAIAADTQRAISMRRDGSGDEAETLLRGLLIALPDGPLRHHVLQTLINTLSERFPALAAEAAEEVSALAHEVGSLADEAERMPDVGDEERGALYLNASEAVLWSLDLERVIEMRRKAVQHLLRCNSRYLDRARESYENIVAFRDSLPKGDEVAETANLQDSPGEQHH